MVYFHSHQTHMKLSCYDKEISMTQPDKRHVVLFKVEMYEQLIALSHTNGETVSHTIRHAVREHLQRYAVRSSKPQSKPEQALAEYKQMIATPHEFATAEEYVLWMDKRKELIVLTGNRRDLLKVPDWVSSQVRPNLDGTFSLVPPHRRSKPALDHYPTLEEEEAKSRELVEMINGGKILQPKPKTPPKIVEVPDLGLDDLDFT